MNNSIRVGDHWYNGHVLIEITKMCNLRCLHCFTNGGNLAEDELSEKDWSIVLNDLIKRGFNAFTISGGEPLLKINKTLALINIIKETHKKVKIYLFTNGLLLDRESIKLFKKSISGVGISIDGNQETHDWLRNRVGAYSLAVRSLHLLKEENIPVFVQCMATPQTLPIFENVVKLATNNDVKAIRFSHVDYFGRGKDNREEIGLKNDQVIRLDKMINSLQKTYKNISISSNLVYRKDLKKNKDLYLVPNLHILPNGIVLPWEGFPEEYALWKYPHKTINTVSKKVINQQIQKFRDLLLSVIGIALKNRTPIVLLDNIIAGVLQLS